jgi:hypothetical protein
MNMTRKAYVVRDADSGIPSDVTQVYAYTLKGLTTALEDARLRSFRGIPQEVAVMTDGKATVIRRFEHGHEITPRPRGAPLPMLRDPYPASRAGTARAGTPCASGALIAGGYLVRGRQAT